MKKTKDFDLKPFKAYVQFIIFHINKMKWEPDECSASDCAINSSGGV